VHRVQPRVAQEVESCPTCLVVETSTSVAVKEKSFDEFHLYTLQNPSTLHDQETKQVEFVRAEGVKSTRFYVYDGTLEQPCIESCPLESMGSDPEESANYGLDRINKKVGVFQEFRNSKENHLGIALPEGRVRFYRRDEEGALQFTGENTIEHTPKDETVRFYTGNAFDLVGERRQTRFQENEDAHWMNESFEIKLRNHKKTPVTVRVVEHLYRWSTWSIRANSAPFKKRDSQTIEFAVAIPPDGERVVTYTAHYTW
jgi:hypothetical protein